MRLFRWLMMVILLYSCGEKVAEEKQTTSAPRKEIVKEPLVIELYAKQFSWTVRYAGLDNKLGWADYKLISDQNPLGVHTNLTREDKLLELDTAIRSIRKQLSGPIESAHLEHQLINDLEKFERFKTKIGQLKKDSLEWANDDIITHELHLPVDREVRLHLRSQDVIHSAYMPHFRVQMNAVPGTMTFFKFKPIHTTKEMRKRPETIALMDSINQKRLTENKHKDEFEYVLLCNKICGVGHSNMQIKVVVEEQKEFEHWLASQPTFLTYRGKK